MKIDSNIIHMYRDMNLDLDATTRELISHIAFRCKDSDIIEALKSLPPDVQTAIQRYFSNHDYATIPFMALGEISACTISAFREKCSLIKSAVMNYPSIAKDGTAD